MSLPISIEAEDYDVTYEIKLVENIFVQSQIQDRCSIGYELYTEKTGKVITVTNNKYNGIECIEVLPVQMKEGMPLVIFLSGNGGYEYLEYNIFMQYIENGNKNSECIFIAPNNNSEYGSDTLNLIDFIDEVSEKYKVDKNRIIISGASAGAGQAAQLISENPDYFALGILISGYLGSIDKETKTPLLLAAGSGDEWSYAVPDKQIKWAEEINYNNGNAFFMLIEGANHIDTPNIFTLPQVWDLIYLAQKN